MKHKFLQEVTENMVDIKTLVTLFSNGKFNYLFADGDHPIDISL